MKFNKITAVLLAALLFGSSCASIVSKSMYPISIKSDPKSNYTIIDGKGVTISSGSTPATVRLKAAQGFFKRASYQVKFNAEGYDEMIMPIYFKVDGWYWGNIVFGGFIGFLILDPATGAMYKLDTPMLNANLSKSGASLENSPQLKIFEINQIPEDWKEHLVLLED